MRVYIQELPGGSYRKVTEEELTEALKKQKRRQKLERLEKRIKQELETQERNCKHPVVYDEEGYIYHFRHCIICGHVSFI